MKSGITPPIPEDSNVGRETELNLAIMHRFLAPLFPPQYFYCWTTYMLWDDALRIYVRTNYGERTRGKIVQIRRPDGQITFKQLTEARRLLQRVMIK